MESSLNKIKSILKKEIGLDASTIGQATIDKILNERMRSCKITELDDYYIHLNNNNQELHLLLETSVIPETWLFRDDKPFKIILDKISRQLVSHPEKLCSILCIPCSTGEEPYSIAIDLTDNGIPKSSFEIQAVDISHNSIAIAKQAVYGSNSFRSEKSKQHIEKYFTPVKSEYRLHDNVKSLVNFNQVNIIDRKTLPFVEKFNFILCRNLLIYFDTSTKATAYNNLHSLLSDDGILFIGHSEFGSVPDDIFVTKKIDSVYCLIKKSNDHPNNKRQINSQLAALSKTIQTR